MLDAFFRDLRYAFRQFARQPGFTLTAVLVLALGLGANTAIFSVVNAFLLRPLPYPHPDRLVRLRERARGRGGDENMGLSPGNFLDWRKQAATFEQISAFTTGPANLSSVNHTFEAERIQVCNSSANFLATLEVAPLLGRAFRPDEDGFGAPHVALVSYNLWQRRLGGQPDVLGAHIRLDSDDYQVVGVLPRGFLFPNDTVEAWVPLLNTLPADLQTRHDLHFLAAVGRIRAGVPLSRARAEIDGIAARYKQAHPEVATGIGVSSTPLHDDLVRDAHTWLLILLGAVGCVLLIACVNVANLLLTRCSGRARELSVRAAIGASRGEIMRHLLTESGLLALVGGVGGMGLTAFLTPILMAHAPGATAVLSGPGDSWTGVVFLFALGIALATGIAVGIFPAWQASRIDPAAGLRESTRSATAGRSHSRFRGVLIASEVALSLVLLVAAGLLLRSFARLLQVRPGLRTDNVLTMTFSLPNTYKEAAAYSQFFQQVSERLQMVPGVAAVGMAGCPPLAGDCNTLFFYRDDRPFVQGRFLAAREQSIDPHYLAAAGVPLLRGRNFTMRDGIGFDPKNPRPGSILINEAMAREFFQGEDPLGKRIFFDYEVVSAKAGRRPLPKYEVIGVIGNVVSMLDREPQPTMYRPLLDGTYGGATILLHTEVPPRAVMNAALNEIHKLDSSLAIYDVRTMPEVMGSSAADRQFTLLLFGAFAGLAVLLAAIGLYGVLSYAVAQRRAEIGIRIALGASHSDVSHFVLWEGMKPALAGVVVGLLAALFACRALKTLLFGIAPLDPVTFSLVPPLLVAIAALACYLPAMLATRIDPTEALRSE